MTENSTFQATSTMLTPPADMYMTTSEFPEDYNNGSDKVYPYEYTTVDEYMPPEHMQAIMIIMYTVITILAVGGNVIVVYVVLAYQQMRTITNYFIVNLAVGDILMAILCIPFTFVSSLLLNYWPFGEVMCHIIPFVQSASVFVSAYTLVTISVDRYVAIIYPLRPRMTEFVAKCVIGVVWAFSLFLPLPTAILSTTKGEGVYAEGARQDLCREQWPGDGEDGKMQLHAKNYTTALMVLQFAVPFAVLAFTYSRICYTLWWSRAPGEAENTRDQRMEKSKRKMVKMMITVVIIFGILWIPFNVVLLVGAATEWAFPHSNYFYFISHWLAMSHSCVNPFIYCWMNSRFREGFKHAFRFFPCYWNPGDSREESSGGICGMERCNTFTTTVKPGIYFRQFSKGACIGMRSDSELNSSTMAYQTSAVDVSATPTHATAAAESRMIVDVPPERSCLLAPPPHLLHKPCSRQQQQLAVTAVHDFATSENITAATTRDSRDDENLAMTIYTDVHVLNGNVNNNGTVHFPSSQN